MQRDKAKLVHQGRTYLEHAIERLQQVADQVVISGCTDVPHHLQTIADPVDFQGPVVGINAALAFAIQHEFAACLVMPIDTPNLTVADLLRLRDRWRIDDSLMVAVSDRIEPLIGIYPVAFAGAIDRLARSDDRSLYRWVESQPYSPLPCPADHLRNINTPEDYCEHGAQ
jgi:molybdopterin-guanine dinucleotide biosynthesis protein A